MSAHTRKICFSEPPLGEFGMAYRMEGTSFGCHLNAHHAGLHRVTLPAFGKFGLVLRMEWFDAFPDEPSFCTGAGTCTAPVHIHGCFADQGSCDDPTEHDEAEA